MKISRKMARALGRKIVVPQTALAVVAVVVLGSFAFLWLHPNKAFKPESLVEKQRVLFAYNQTTASPDSAIPSFIQVLTGEDFSYVAGPKTEVLAATPPPFRQQDSLPNVQSCKEFLASFGVQSNRAVSQLGFNILNDWESVSDLAVRSNDQVHTLANNFVSDIKAPYLAAASVLRPALREQKNQAIALGGKINQIYNQQLLAFGNEGIKFFDGVTSLEASSVSRAVAAGSQVNNFFAQLNKNYNEILLACGQAGIKSLDQLSISEARQASHAEVITIDAQVAFADFYAHASDDALALAEPVQLLCDKANDQLLALGQFIIGPGEENILPEMTHEKMLATKLANYEAAIKLSSKKVLRTNASALLAMAPNGKGQVLAAHTVAQQSASAASLSRQVKDILYGFMQQGLFGLSASNYAPDGILHVGVNNGQTYSVSSGLGQNSGGQTTSVIGGSFAPVSYVFGGSASNYTTGSMGSFTDLSATNFSSGNNTNLNLLNVSGAATLSSALTVAGNTSLASASITSLALSQPLSLTSGGLGIDASAILKGGILAGTGSGMFGIQTAGSDGLCLSASSTAVSGLAWTACTSSSTAVTLLNGQSQGSQTFATGSDANIVLTVISQNGIHTFTPSWQGQLAVSRGGTGTSTAPTANQILIGNGAGGYNLVATSTLGLQPAGNYLTAALTSLSGMTGPALTIATSTSGNTFTYATSTNQLTLTIPQNLINSVATSSSSGSFYVSTSSTGSTNALTINFPNNLVTSVSGSGSLLSSGGTTPTLQLQNLTSGDLLFGAGSNTLATSTNLTFTGNNLLSVNGSINASSSNFTNASTSNLTVTSFSNSNTYCVHSVNGLLQTTASDCGAGGGGGGGWSTSSPNTIYNSFGTLVGINSTTPIASLTVQGKSGSTTPIFVVASSTNAQYLTVLANGNVGIGTSAPAQTLTLQGTSGTDLLNIASSTGTSVLYVAQNGNIGIGTTTPAATLNVLGTGIIQSSTNTPTAFQVQNASGTPILLVDTTPTFGATTTNYIANPGFEVNTSGWAASGTGATIARVTTNKYMGLASLKIDSYGSGAGQGASTTAFVMSPAAGTYVLSFYARTDISSSSFSTLMAGYSTSTQFSACTLNSNTVSNLGWRRYNCSFTVSGPITQIFIGQSDANPNRTFYIDSIQLQLGSAPTPYAIGNIQLRGVITSPVSLQSLSNSVTAFQIQDQTGVSNLFIADTLNNAIDIGTSTGTSVLNIQGAAGTSNSLLNISSSTGASMFYIAATGRIGISSSTPAATLSLQGTSGTNALYIASSTGTGLMVIQQNGNVGIGSSTPTGLLSVQGTSGVFTDLSDLVFTGTGPLAATTVNGLKIQSYLTYGAGGQFNGIYLPITGSGTATGTIVGINIGSITAGSATATAISIGSGWNSYLNLATTATTTLINIQGTAGRDTLNISSSTGASMFYIAATGRIGISSSTPAATLSLQGTSGTNALYIASSTGTGLMVIQQNGNVGIGSSTPTGLLSVQGTSGVFTDLSDLVFTGTGPLAATTVNGLKIQSYLTYGAGGQFNGIYLPITGSGTATGTIVGINIGSITAGSATATAISIGSGWNSYLNLATTATTTLINIQGTAGRDTLNISSSTGASMFYITNGGNVGIGSSSPIATLALTGTVGTNPLVVASSTGTQLLTILQNGNVGINTSTPGATLAIQTQAGVNAFTVASSTGSTTTYFTITSIGNVGVGTATPASRFVVAANCSGFNANPGACSDYAELYPASEDITAGDVVVIDTSASAAAVRLSTSSYDSNLLGVVSTNPAMVIEGDSVQFMNGNYHNDPRRPAVALAGRVPVKVTNENGNIYPGDYLTSSASRPGFAMKATGAGMVLGQALESFNPSFDNATGTVMVFIKPMHYVPKVADLLQIGANIDNQAWLLSLANLNMTNASVFGDIAVTGSLAVQNDLHVGGIIYVATLNVDTINAKKLCLGQTCVTEDQLKAILQFVNSQNQNSSNQPVTSGSGQAAPSTGGSSDFSTGLRLRRDKLPLN